MGAIIFFIGFVFVASGIVQLFQSNNTNNSNSENYRRNSRGSKPTPFMNMVHGEQNVRNTSRTMPSIEPSTTGAPPMATGKQGDFQRARIGQTITVNHPQRGAITGKILATIRYTELWQRVKSPSEPWVPTGNQFTAHWLGNFMLYEWKENFWLLDQYDPLTDKDIATNFMPYAKRFGESNETADVFFAYPPASWKMTDIGKFSVQSAEGTGLRLGTGAVGRFIHASGDGGRALVVEDYQSGQGGQDTAWIGFQIAWDDIQKIA
jgi:hypothetical protein